MIEPTKELARILAKNNSKMTIFWDILHYYKLLENKERFTEMSLDVSMLEDQILSLIQRGHEVQLHLHPHWLDAKYDDKGWHFDYSRFKLQNLSENFDKNDINTIIGCISVSKRLMESIIRKVKPDYQVTSFRAGGYLVQPFSKLKEALLSENIRIDSSVCSGLKNNNGIFSYDFKNYPHKLNYLFSDDPGCIVENGIFTEFPIKTLKISTLYKVYFILLRHLKYRNLELGRKGTGSGDSTKYSKKNVFTKIIGSLTTSQRMMLTTDSSFKEKFDFIFKRADDYSVMILHTKLLNHHTLALLDELINANKVQFLGLSDCLPHV